MALVMLSYEGEETELEEQEAIGFFCALKEGLEKAGIATEKLSTISRPIGVQTFHQGNASSEQTDC